MKKITWLLAAILPVFLLVVSCDKQIASERDVSMRAAGGNGGGNSGGGNGGGNGPTWNVAVSLTPSQTPYVVGTSINVDVVTTRSAGNSTNAPDCQHGHLQIYVTSNNWVSSTLIYNADDADGAYTLVGYTPSDPGTYCFKAIYSIPDNNNGNGDPNGVCAPGAHESALTNCITIIPPGGGGGDCPDGPFSIAGTACVSPVGFDGRVTVNVDFTVTRCETGGALLVKVQGGATAGGNQGAGDFGSYFPRIPDAINVNNNNNVLTWNYLFADGQAEQHFRFSYTRQWSGSDDDVTGVWSASTPTFRAETDGKVHASVDSCP